MEWTIQQIVVTLAGVVITGIIIYYAFTQIAWSSPAPDIETNILPAFAISLSLVKKKVEQWTQ